MKKLDCILLIEDDHLTNIYNEKIIGKMNICSKVSIVKSGQEALEYLSALNGHARPDLILLDINMPRMSGWEFIEEYHKLHDEVRRDIKIIFLTSSPNPDDIKRARTIPGITGFETKPLTPDKLNGILSRYFNGATN